jgi:hypothetical protein
MENSMRYLQKLKTISYDLDTYPDEWNSECQGDIYILLFVAVLFTTAKMGKQPECSQIDEWIRNM